MKHVSRLLSLLILVSAGLFYISCDGGEDEKGQEELQLDKLKATWTLQSVDNDATDRTDEYPNMSLVISGTFSEGGTYNYTSDADEWPPVSPWKKADTWKFKAGAVTSAVVRQSDLLEMTYSLSNGDKTLTLSFNYQGEGIHNGRTESVTGNWDFVFTRP